MVGAGEAYAPAERLPAWVTLRRAPNPGPMTLDGTNTWVLRAAPGAPALVVDPGPDDDDHLAAIAAAGPVAALLVTHGHADHVAGAARASRLLGDVPVLAADPGRGIRSGPLRAGPLTVPDQRGAEVAAADSGMSVQVLATPGHTADSVCFLARHAGEAVLLTGDTILGRGTAVIAWPDGDLGAYLDSLAALAAYDLPVLPGHGPPLADCAAAARAYLAHRHERLAQVRAAVAAGARTPAEVVAAVYPQVEPAVRFAAEWSVRAQLAYLMRESNLTPDELDRP